MLFTANRFDRAAHRGTVLDVTRTTGSIFAPSPALLADYKAGRCDWPGYTRRYREEMRALWRREPQVFLDLVTQAAASDVTLTCWERAPDGDERRVQCHRRLLWEYLVAIGLRVGAVLDPDTDDLTRAALETLQPSSPLPPA